MQAFILSLSLGLLLWYPNRRAKQELRSREGFLIVVLFWTVLGSIGAIPLLSEQPALSVGDSVFEAFSALTTTGATVITGSMNCPKRFCFIAICCNGSVVWGSLCSRWQCYRCGIGGMQLSLRNPGPVKDHKMTPRIAETAKALWYIYLALTIACALAYWLAGMNTFDAIGHAFSTIRSAVSPATMPAWGILIAE